MKTILNNQRRISAILAIALAIMVTFVAGGSSYGETIKNENLNFSFDEAALLERAMADLEEDDFDFVLEEEAEKTIQIYDANDNLLETITLAEGEVVEDTYSQRLLNQAEFLSEYGNTMVYKVSE